MSEQLQLEDEDVNITLRRGWDRAIRLLAERVNKPTWETHIRVIRPITLVERTENRKSVYYITLGVPSAFTRDWVEKRHTNLIVQALEETFDRDVRLAFTLLSKEEASSNRPARASSPAASATPPSAASAVEGAIAVDPASSTNTLSFEGILEGLEVTPAVPVETPAKGTGKAGGRRGGSGSENVAKGTPGASTAASAAPRVAQTGGDITHLNPRYTFETFVVGPSNRLAHAGAKAVAETPGQVYNPLFLYGPSGLGKTHLMHAIGHEIARTRPATGDGACRVAYVSGEAFTSHFITSLREHKGEEFRRRWRSVDLWLVDDIQFIVGKERTNEEFFHTFNALYQMGKQIVISSDRSPRELQAMDERLRSRFESGLIADVAPPDLETRLAILHRKASSEKARVSDDVLLYIARLVQSNIRTLEGALVKLIASASLQNVPITPELATQVLERYYGQPAPASHWDAAAQAAAEGFSRAAANLPRTYVERAIQPVTGGGGDGWRSAPVSGGDAFSRTIGRGGGGDAGITPEVIQRIVAHRFNLEPSLLTGKKRDREIVNARQIAMHLTREMTETSLPGIGQWFGGRDHSTVMHACDRVRNQIPIDDGFRHLVEDLATQIRAQAAG